LAVAAEGKFAVGAVGGVVIDLAGEFGAEDGFEVEGGGEFVEFGNAGVGVEGVLLAAQEGRAGDEGGEGAEGLAAGG